MRAIELGAGTGLAGIVCSMSKCNVMLTDLEEVLPHLKRNVHEYKARASSKHQGGNQGLIRIQELKWGDTGHISRLKAQFPLVLAADCIFREDLIAPLIHTIDTVGSHSMLALVAMEIRSRSVCTQFLREANVHFDLRRVPCEGGAVHSLHS